MLVLLFSTLCLDSEACCLYVFFFFRQKTAYDFRISDWSSVVCSSDLGAALAKRHERRQRERQEEERRRQRPRLDERERRRGHECESEPDRSLEDRKSVV